MPVIIFLWRLFMSEIRILGAGLSGLSAAINLVKLGRDVVVYEKKKQSQLPAF